MVVVSELVAGFFCDGERQSVAVAGVNPLAKRFF